MTRWLFAVVVGVQLTTALTGVRPMPVAAQDVQLAMRRPRFLEVRSAKSAPVEIDARNSAILRQLVSVEIERATVGDVLTAIERQTGIRFIYSRGVIAVDRPVRVRAERITVAGALTEVFLDSGIDVLLKGNHLALVERPSTKSSATGAIVGRVRDGKTGRGIAGADVLLDGTRWRTTTDSAGRYRLAEIDSGSYTLLARRLGFAKQTRKVVVEGEREDTVDLALEALAVPLDELVTTATGQQRRRDLGNAITTIRADSVLRTAPIRNLTDLLENRVPGMSLQHTSGAPGDPARIRLRGVSSVLRGNDPVVIVDGIRVYAAQSVARSGNLTNLAARPVDPSGRPTGNPISSGNVPAPSPLDQIDPNTIDKIEVFKGPSAATLYGADAANGVIVITTKKGKTGPTRWSFSAQRGRTTTAGAYPTGYYRWGHIVEEGNLPMFCTIVDLRCIQDSLVRYQALNDPAMTILGTGDRSALSLTASGGNQALTYSVTGSYGNEIGLLTLPTFEIDRFRTLYNRDAPDWMRRPHHYDEWHVNSNVNARLGATADLTLSTTLARSEQERTGLEDQQASLARTYVDKVTGLYYTAQRSSPVQVVGDAPAYSYILSGTTAPLASYGQRTKASTITVTTGLAATWHPKPWFSGLSRAGLNIVPRADETLLPSLGGTPECADCGSQSALARGTGRSLESTFDLQGTFRRALPWGFRFETGVGANLVNTTTSDVVSAADGLVPGTSSFVGAKHFSVTDAQVRTSVFGWYVEPRITGQRFALSTGIRLDGGSAYGARITGGIGSLLALPKLNGSWVISEEPWFPFKTMFNSLRLRGAYGQAQVQPGVIDRLRLYTARTDATGGRGVLDLTSLGNTELKPERSTEFEGGFDADVLDSRLSVELTGYRKVQVDALMPVTLPVSVGGGSVVQNIGNIRNTGLEVTARVTPLQSRLATWGVELNYSRNTNLLTKLGPSVERNPRQGFVAGYPVGGRWSQPILGFADKNGDGVIEGGEVQIGDSLVYMGQLLPAYQTALATNLALLNGSLGVTAGFSYQAGQTQIDQTAQDNWVLSRALADPSTPFAQQAAVIVSNLTDYGVTQTVSTFRFNSLSVTYRAPASMARWLRAERLSIALQGSNLGLHSSYRGKDPDVTAWSPTERIVDTGQLAQPRTWQLAMYLDF